MFRQGVNFKVVALQIFVLIALLTSGVSSVDAKGLESELWGIDWASNNKQIVQVLERLGFTIDGQGDDADGKWLKLANGKFLGYQCNVEARWINNELSKFVISLAEKGSKTESIYQELAKYFQENYGTPANNDRYYLKIYPPVKVEVMVWKVSGEGDKFFEVLLKREGTENFLGEEPADSRIEITVIKKNGNDISTKIH